MIFFPGEHVVQVSQEQETILTAALEAGLDLDHTCGGNGTCGTCMVEVLKGLELLPPRNEVEQELAEARGLDSHERLCCQLQTQDGLVLKVPHKKDLCKSK